jgi:hypothetical protein
MNDIKDKFLALGLTIFLLLLYGFEYITMKTQDEFIKNLVLMAAGAFIAMLRQTPQPVTEIKNSEQTSITSGGKDK